MRRGRSYDKTGRKIRSRRRVSDIKRMKEEEKEWRRENMRR